MDLGINFFDLVCSYSIRPRFNKRNNSNRMPRLITIIAAAIMALASAQAAPLADETLHYKVMYKWGLINKNAGSVEIKLRGHGDTYEAELTAASAPWADKIYCVRDTLRSQFKKAGLKPIIYEKFAHEGNEDKYDRVRYSYRGATAFGDCYRLAYKKGQLKRDETRSLEATGTTVDMLTAFYYMRRLPFDKWEPGHVLTINIFSGKQQELLSIKYHGTEEVESDDGVHTCYKITFIFTSNGKKKTSDDMFAWIDTSTLIPIKLEGKLPIGSVRCYFTGS